MRTIRTASVLTGILLAGAPAMADLTSTIEIFDSFGSGQGGEFLAKVHNVSFTPVGLGTDARGRFETFCLEKNEVFQPGSTYYFDINTAAINGGVSGGNPDPLSGQTAYLYKQFITGNLGGYNYGTGSGRISSANALQNTIWYLENEITNRYDGLNSSERSLVDQFLADASAHAGSDIGNVRVMNIFAQANGTGVAQDQLVMVHAVPAPGAAMLAFVGLGIVGWAKRKIS